MLAITLTCFLIPIFLTKKFESLEVGITKVEEPQVDKKAEYSYPQYATIKLFHSKDSPTTARIAADNIFFIVVV